MKSGRTVETHLQLVRAASEAGATSMDESVVNVSTDAHAEYATNASELLPPELLPFLEIINSKTYKDFVAHNRAVAKQRAKRETKAALRLI